MPTAERAALLDACERAVPAVLTAWPQWAAPEHDVPERGVPEVVIIRAESPLPPGIAARVEGLARDGESTNHDRLVVTPGLPAQLSSAGLDVVLRHELTHLAMRSTGTAPIPLWAAEGFAEYVAYASVPDERRERASELERLQGRVAAGEWDGTVPNADQLEAAGSDADLVQDAYTAAWLGMVVLVDGQGLDAIRTAMQPAHESVPGLSDADRESLFLARLDLGRPDLDRMWRAALASGGAE